MDSKYGFDYFTKRAELLAEMAGRPSPLTQLGEAGVKMKQILDTVMRTMRSGNIENSDGDVIPGLPRNLATNRTLRYLIYMLSGDYNSSVSPMDDPETDFSENKSKDAIILASQKILGLPTTDNYKKQGFADPDKLYRAAITHSIKNSPELILSPEFQETILNPTNIADNMQEKRTGATTYSINKARQQEELHGDTIENIHASETAIKDIITKIHKAIAYRKMKKNPEFAKDNEVSTNDINNDFIDNVYSVLNAIDNIEYYHKKIHEEFNKRIKLFEDPQEALTSIIDDYPDMEPSLIITLYKSKNLSQLLQQIKEEYSTLKDSGIDLKTLYNQLESYKTEDNSDVIDALIEEMDNLISTNEELDISQSKQEKPKAEFPGYPQDITDHFLTTPELKKHFQKYYNWMVVEMERQAEIVKDKILSLKWGEGEIPGELGIVRKAHKDFFDKRPEVKKQSFQNPESVNPQFTSKPKNESYVMEYMTEQVYKDKFKPKGEFRDRGFKKPKNYWEGLNR
jgi:hypothetical protein